MALSSLTSGCQKLASPRDEQPALIQHVKPKCTNVDALRLDMLNKRGHFYKLNWRLDERMEFRHWTCENVDYTIYFVLKILSVNEFFEREQYIYTHTQFRHSCEVYRDRACLASVFTLLNTAKVLD